MDIDWNQLVEAVSQLIREHWLKVLTSGAFLLIGICWGRWRTYVAWTRREFLGRLNISLNSIEGTTLRIRTLVEKNLQDVLLNRFAVEAVQRAARKTTPKNPILPLADDDKWPLLNAVLNEVSEKFAEGFLRRDMGLPVVSETYLVCLTHECAGTVRTRKVRAMLIRKRDLLALPEQLQLESPNHQTRVNTLQFLAEAYQRQPEDFLEMEICVAAAAVPPPLTTTENQP